jgi:hypothetical protein
MKNLFVPLLVLLVFVACDMSNVTPQVVSYPSNDADFVSFTGLRQETYYLRPDPSLDTSLVTMAIAEEAFFTLDSNNKILQSPLMPNAATITFPLKALFEAGDYPMQSSGTIIICYRTDLFENNPSYHGFLSVAFNNMYTMPLEFFHPTEEYEIDDPFTGSSLTLPLKGYRPDPYYLTFRGRTFTVRLSLDQFRTLATPMGSYPEHIIMSGYYYNPLPAAPEVTGPLTGSVYRQDPYRPVSREFYRYKHFTITYPGTAPIFVVAPEPVVESYSLDPDTNSLSVTLKDYNAPYTGPLLTFWIQTEDGTVRQKVIGIGEA